jgi:outer membrane protein TolC
MPRFSAKIVLWAVLAVCLNGVLSAQTLTLQQALDTAVQRHPAAKSAALQLQQQQQLLPAAATLPDPVLTAESPTGEFYAVGIAQSFELPGAYRRRKRLQETLVARAESASLAVQQEVRYATALAYSGLQYRLAFVEQFKGQDSVLQTIAAAAARMFEQGQMDAVASQFARLQAAALRVQLRQAEQDAAIAESQLQTWTGISGHIVPEPLSRPALPPLLLPTAPDSFVWQNNPALLTLQQEILAAERQTQVEKSRGLPQFTLGYLNQGERNSPVGNRFNAGLSIPLWRRQYNANTLAAETGAEIARQNLAAQSLQLDAAYRRALGVAEKAALALEEYEKTVLPAARSLSDASRRLFEGGLTDLVSYLRNRKDVLDAELGYWELLWARQMAGLELRYLSGGL